MVERPAFRDGVRRALLCLYDYERLSVLPLGAWLQVQPGHAGQRTLRQTLLDAIESLKPGPGTPAESPNWRPYRILFYRFVQGMTVAEVASQLGFGDRHFRRHQARAIRQLADVLWEGRPGSTLPPAGAAQAADRPEPQADPKVDLAWLQKEPGRQQASLSEVMAGAESIVSRHIAAQGVRLEAAGLGDLPPLSIHPQALRQVLVNVLSYAAGLAPGGRLEVQACALEKVVRIQVALQATAPHPGPASPPEAEALSISRQLLSMYEAELELAALPGEQPAITIEVPISRRLPVLIVDDNADTATLFARYLADSPYEPMTAHTGQEGLLLAQRLGPSAIVLDVMMPAQDGWEVLSLLKTHPLTGEIPVIVATILTDRELARSLGAAAFLHKPVSQAELLAALAQLAG